MPGRVAHADAAAFLESMEALLHDPVAVALLIGVALATAAAILWAQAARAPRHWWLQRPDAAPKDRDLSGLRRRV